MIKDFTPFPFLNQTGNRNGCHSHRGHASKASEGCDNPLAARIQAAQQADMLNSLVGMLGKLLSSQGNGNCGGLQQQMMAFQQMQNGAAYNQGFQQGMAYNQGLQAGLAAGLHSAYGPQGQPSLPETEMQRGQTLSNGNNAVTVGQDGSMSYSHKSCGGDQNITISNGQVHLPSGQNVAVQTRGVIVKMADGSEMAVGRNDNNGPANRWAVAGAGQNIPCSPPGATTVIQLDPSGHMVSQSVR